MKIIKLTINSSEYEDKLHQEELTVSRVHEEHLYVEIQFEESYH